MFPPCLVRGLRGALEIMFTVFDNRTNDRLPFNSVYRVDGSEVKKKDRPSHNFH
jgi:hypothetical protein